MKLYNTNKINEASEFHNHHSCVKRVVNIAMNVNRIYIKKKKQIHDNLLAND